jgi:putative oligomerization/nucleic acid binding protein
MGLIGGMARTAVVAGTATAVSNRVSRRQARRWSAQDEADYIPARVTPTATYQEPPPPPPPAPAEAGPSRTDQLRDLADLKAQGILTDEEFAREKARILGY